MFIAAFVLCNDVCCENILRLKIIMQLGNAMKNR